MSDARAKQAIRDWWAAYPMTYGEEHGDASYRDAEGRVVRVARGTRRFFELADERFYAWNEPHHEPGGRPFGRLFDYGAYRGAAVLEVGCGMGCMAMNWARAGARVSAVDLSPVAVAETRRRFETFGLEGEIREADGHALPFADDHFAYAFSWGVLHHSPHPRRAIAELHRVLAPGGRVGVMLYHRRSFLYRAWVRWQEGFVNLESRFLPELDLASRYTDGARAEGNPHTWPVTREECRRSLFAPFEDVELRTFGTDVPNVLDTFAPGLGAALPARLRESLARRFGWSLWITGRKASAARAR